MDPTNMALQKFCTMIQTQILIVTEPPQYMNENKRHSKQHVILQCVHVAGRQKNTRITFTA